MLLWLWHVDRGQQGGQGRSDILLAATDHILVFWRNSLHSFVKPFPQKCDWKQHNFVVKTRLYIYDRKERSRFSSATVVCKLCLTQFLSSQLYFSCIGERMENVHDYVLTYKSKDDKRDMLQPRARRITSWLFDATSYTDFCCLWQTKDFKCLSSTM